MLLGRMTCATNRFLTDRSATIQTEQGSEAMSPLFNTETFIKKTEKAKYEF